MKTLLAATLLSLPLVAFAGDETPPPADKGAQTAPVKGAGGDKSAATKAKPGKATKAKAKPKQKPAAQPAAHEGHGAAKQDAAKKDEKPCEPVKPCAID